VNRLLKAGAEVNEVAKNPTGFTALTGAIAGGHHDIAESLLAQGANANHRYEEGFTPLMEAAASGYLEITRLLLTHGADTRVRMAGKTALDYAIEKGQSEVAALLKEHEKTRAIS
jgi:ankyrin repeat protein